MVDLSITFVAYKNYTDIRQALVSYRKYAKPAISKIIYIVDNSSSDATTAEDREALLVDINKCDDICYIDAHENLGFGKANNIVLNKLDSKYHAIVNPDILFIEDPFEKMIQYLEKNHDVGMCIPKIIDQNGDIQQVYRRELTLGDMFIRMFASDVFKSRYKKHTMQDMDYSKPFQVPFGQGSFLLIRTELFRELNGFDERYFMYVEDADLCKRVNQVSKLMYFPDSVVIHKWEKGSHKNITLFKEHLRSMRLYFNKWGWKLF